MDFLWLIVKFVVTTYVMEKLRPQPKQTGPAAAGLKDLAFPTADPTRPVQWLIGTRLVDSPNLFGTWDFKPVKRSKRVRSGLFSKTTVPLPWYYYLTMAMVLCGGSNAKLRRIYCGDRLLWEGELTDGGHVDVNLFYTDDGQDDYHRGLKARIEFHSGSTVPNAYLDAKLGGKAPTWKHLTYVVVRGIPGSAYDGAWIGTSTRVEHLKFETERMPSAATTGLGEHPNGGSYWTIGQDANPAYAAAEVLVSEHYGAGQDPAELDAASFHAAAKVLHEEAHGTSQEWDSQRKSGDVVLELCRQVGAIVQPEPTQALYRFRLLRETDPVVMVLDDSNVKSVEAFSRATVDEATNALRLEYTARDEQYKQRPIEVQDLAAVQAAGQVIAGTAQYAGITSPEVAVKVGMRDLRAMSAPLATERLTAIVPKTQRLLPGDVALRVAPEDGVAALRMRVTGASYAKPGTASCELELIEDVFFSGSATYTVPPLTEEPDDAVSMPSQVDAGGANARFILAPYALSKDAADHALFYASAPDVETTEYSVGLYADGATEPDELENPVEFAAFGTLRAQIAETAATTAIEVNIGAVAAAALERHGSGAVFAVIESGALEPEWVQAGSVTLSTDKTKATLSGLKRGIFDTINRYHPAGAAVHILCGYALDPMRLATAPAAANGVAYTSYEGQGALEIEAYGRNGLGTAGAGSRAAVLRTTAGGAAGTTPPGGVRAPLPMPPGRVQFDSIYGGSTQDRAIARSVHGSSGTTIKWVPRSKASNTVSHWLSTEAEAEAGVFYFVSVDRWTGSAWSNLHTVTTAVGATQASVTPTGWSGLVRITVTPRIAAGTGSHVSGKPQSWFWNLTVT